MAGQFVQDYPDYLYGYFGIMNSGSTTYSIPDSWCWKTNTFTLKEWTPAEYAALWCQKLDTYREAPYATNKFLAALWTGYYFAPTENGQWKLADGSVYTPNDIAIGLYTDNGVTEAKEVSHFKEPTALPWKQNWRVNVLVPMDKIFKTGKISFGIKTDTDYEHEGIQDIIVDGEGYNFE